MRLDLRQSSLVHEEGAKIWIDPNRPRPPVASYNWLDTELNKACKEKEYVQVSFLLIINHFFVSKLINYSIHCRILNRLSKSGKKLTSCWQTDWDSSAVFLQCLKKMFDLFVKSCAVQSTYEELQRCSVTWLRPHILRMNATKIVRHNRCAQKMICQGLRSWDGKPACRAQSHYGPEKTSTCYANNCFIN